MSERMDLFVFGDQAVDLHTFLKDVLSRGKSNTLFSSFISQASAALREEVSQLSAADRESIPTFSTIQELADRYREGQILNTTIDSALLCVTQLAHYIGCTEENFSNEIDCSKSCIVGLCTGSLAAAAVASSPSPSTLIPLAVEVVRIAFRTGLHVSSAAKRVYQAGNSREQWSVLVPDTTEAEARHALRNFHEHKGTPLSSRAYISAVSANVVTISGPPPVLKQIFESAHGLKKPRSIQIPVHGPYHAGHIHGNDLLQQILGSRGSHSAAIIDQYAPKISILSTTSGKPFSTGSTRDLLKDIINEILRETLRFDRILDGCAASVKDSKALKCYISSFGPLNIVNSLVSNLKLETSAEIMLGTSSSWMSKAPLESNHGPSDMRDSRLAIVGMAGRFPSAANHEKFWELLEAGLDVHREVPKDRFDVNTHFDPNSKIKNTSHTPYGCFIDDPGLFDPRFFNMSPREAAQTDPMQRLALVTAYEALEMSGYVPNRTPSTKLDRVGTFYGQTSDDWREINEAQDIDTYFITGGVRAFGPGRINYHFKFSGPSLNIDTACSSSMAAIQVACTALRAGECDTAVAGGCSVMTNPDIFSGLSRGQFLSKVGPCQTWDNDADGYCRADGVASVVIKRLQDAEADNDNILAVIRGTATNHSAEAVSITHPHAETQEFLYRKILSEASVDALDVDFVEMHGTGTQAGDGTEMRSVTNVFAPQSRLRRPDQSLYLGAVKANVGHGEAASGVTALIKCLLMLQKNAIPPHVGIKKTINVTFPKDLDQRNVRIAFKPTPWGPRQDKKRLIFVNNFSAAGGNSGLLIEEGPSHVRGDIDSRSTHIVSVSARSKGSLRSNIERLISYIDSQSSTALPDLSYSLTARKIQHNYRVAFTATTIAQAKDELASKLNESVSPVSSTLPVVGFAFTGQGSHYSALARELFRDSLSFKSDILAFDNIAQSLGYPSFIPLVDGSVESASLSALNIQVGLTSIQMALTRLWKSWGIKPDFVMGHSLGEYAAMNAAGILSVSDTIYLVGERARLLQDHCAINSHAMLAVKAPISCMNDLPGTLRTRIHVACINGSQETVFSGSSDDVTTAAEYFQERGIKCTKLNVPYAFHSAQVDPILDSFEALASSVSFMKSKLPVISTLLGEVLSVGESIDPTYLRRHAREPVNFLGALGSGQRKSLIKENTVWVEIGPHPVCIGMIKSTLGSKIVGAATLRRGEDSWKATATSLCVLHKAGLSIDWNEYHRDFKSSLRLLDLPKYAFDDKVYWIQYTGDWCLTKGSRQAPAMAAIEEKKSRLSTTTVQRIVEETIEDGKVTLVTESDLSRPDLNAAVSGHMVNGTALCPSSLYGDMALTVGEYVYKLLRPGSEKVDMDVGSMEVMKPLIKKSGPEPQILRLTVVTNTALTLANLCYSSGEGKSKVDHAKCVVQYGDSSVWLSEWKRNAYLIQRQIKTLQSAVNTGKAHRILRGMAYKLFAGFVQYDQKYRGMSEVIFDSEELEATATVNFQTKESDGTFTMSPYWIDSIGHLSGFIVNATDAVDNTQQVYISHGWESMRMSKPLSADKTYHTYVRMQPAGAKMLAGDVYLFEDDEIVGMMGHVKFQCIPRAVLNTFLPPAGPSHVAAPKPTPLKRAIQTSEPVTITKTKTETMVMKEEIISSISVTPSALLIIADEVGIDVGELEDAVEFADMGVDSLMSLSISGRMREDLELNVPSSVFTDYPTVAKLKGFLSQFEAPMVSSEEQSRFVSQFTLPTLDSEVQTPDLDEDGSIATPSDGSDDGSAIMRTTIVTDIGSVSNHMSLQGNTKEDLEIVLGQRILESSLAKPQLLPLLPSSQPPRTATSVLLQGTPRKATRTLFLIPDGGGSATSYTTIPDLSPTIAVWGLNSPFMKTPTEFTIGVPGIASLYIAEIRRRQPTGPYNLGGWSAGGVIAFECAQQLLRAGAVVEQLLLIDAPCPLTIEPLPASLHVFFNQIGLLGDGLRAENKTPAWLLPHFASSVTALNDYEVEPLAAGSQLKVLAVWCEDGVCKEESDPRPDPYPYGHAQWLLENRTDFGPNLWDRIIDVQRMAIVQMPGNHFTMMREPNVELLGNFLRHAMLSS